MPLGSPRPNPGPAPAGGKFAPGSIWCVLFFWGGEDGGTRAIRGEGIFVLGRMKWGDDQDESLSGPPSLPLKGKAVILVALGVCDPQVGNHCCRVSAGFN